MDCLIGFFRNQNISRYFNFFKQTSSLTQDLVQLGSSMIHFILPYIYINPLARDQSILACILLPSGATCAWYPNGLVPSQVRYEYYEVHTRSPPTSSFSLHTFFYTETWKLPQKPNCLKIKRKFPFWGLRYQKNNLVPVIVFMFSYEKKRRAMKKGVSVGNVQGVLSYIQTAHVQPRGFNENPGTYFVKWSKKKENIRGPENILVNFFLFLFLFFGISHTWDTGFSLEICGGPSYRIFFLRDIITIVRLKFEIYLEHFFLLKFIQILWYDIV